MPKPLITRLLLTTLILCLLAAFAHADVTLGVDSPAVRFSPGNWAGDAGRGGSVRRMTWNNGAWCAFYWSSVSESPRAWLNISNAGRPSSSIAYFMDGKFVDRAIVPQQGGLPIHGVSGTGPHVLVVYTRNSWQEDRWQGRNVFSITGLTLESSAKPGVAPPRRPWVMIVGSSEGIGSIDRVDSMTGDYSFLLEQALAREGYDCGISVCGYSGWVRPGDAHGDVPPYFAVKNGDALPEKSRWNRIDATTSLLDAQGHVSGSGALHDEPTAILFDLVSNDAEINAPLEDVRASVTGALGAMRKAAPAALFYVLVPPTLESPKVYANGDRYRDALRRGVADYRSSHPSDQRIVFVDLGPEVANALTSPDYGTGLHQNTAGHAYMAAQILPGLLEQLARVCGNGTIIPLTATVAGKPQEGKQ